MVWKLCAFGRKAEKLRKGRGMTKAELCRRLEITVTYYDYIIHGARPGLCRQDQILRELGEKTENTA